MEGELSVKIVGLDEIYLAVHDGGDKKIDEETLKKEQGESTTLSVQKVENGAYLKVNNEEISLSNVFENPGQPEEHTVEGVRLQLVFRDAGGSGFTENAVISYMILSRES
ncbi:3786_t:CDS:2 [Entrophospora sp. SA101]|nr:3786_t:CDS:2 [Entrophospora sp. SA101]